MRRRAPIAGHESPEVLVSTQSTNPPVLRVCIVNFNTTRADIEALQALVADLGARVLAERRASRGPSENER